VRWVATAVWSRGSTAARHDGVGVAAVERKAGGRHGGEQGVREARRSAVVVTMSFFNLWRLEGNNAADKLPIVNAYTTIKT
jgi:hypothetical protein